MGAACAVPLGLAKWMYFIAFLLSTVATWVLRDYSSGALDFSPLNAVRPDRPVPGQLTCSSRALQAHLRLPPLRRS